MTETQPHRLLAAGESAFAAGELGRAASLLRAALDAGARGPLRAEIHNDLGVVASAQGRLGDAEIEFRLALEHDAGFADAVRNLVTLCSQQGDTAAAQHWRRRLTEVTVSLGETPSSETMPEAESTGEAPIGGRPLHVLVALDGAFAPADQRFAASVATALRELGHTVEIAAGASVYRSELERAGVELHELPEPEPHAIEDLVERQGYDAMLIVSEPTGRFLSAAVQLSEPRPRLVVVPRVSTTRYNWLRCRQGLLDVYEQTLRRVDAVCVSSQQGCDRKLADVLSVEAQFVPEAAGSIADSVGFRDRYGLNRDRPLLVTVGDLCRMENQLGLLRVLREQPGDWQLALIGAPSPDEPELAADIEAVAAADPRVHLLGVLGLDEIGAALAESDVLLLPSVAEAKPPLLVEAMRRRLAWIATPAGAPADEYAGGIMVPLCRFGEAIRGVLADDHARAALGDSGYEDWQARHTWALAAGQYAQLLAGGSSTGRLTVDPLRTGHIVDVAVRTDDVACAAPEIAETAMARTAAARIAVLGDSLPTVTCVITAHNYEHYVSLAVESVMAQDYPAELLDVVVTDDGSTDGTAGAVERLAALHPGRVTLIRRENGGLAAATASAIAAARGDYLAICDADDLWLPGKVSAQVRVFMERPSVALCYGEMHVIDGDGDTVATSFLSHTVRRGWAFEDLARGNFTTNSTLMWRAGSAPSPVPESPYADYWIALHASMNGEVWGLEQPLAQYRRHGANMGFGSVGAERVPVVQREVRFRRLVLLGEVGAALSLRALVEITLALELKAREILALSPWALVEFARVTDAQREQAAEIVQELAASPSASLETQLRGYCRAMLLDPLNPQAKDRLLAAWTSSNAASELSGGEIGIPDASPTRVARAAALVGEPR